MRSLVLSSLAVASADWTEHEGYNCYAGGGARPERSDDSPHKGKTLDECQALCSKNSDCEAVTRNHGDTVGDCWLRLSVQLDNCARGTAWDTYTNGHTPSPAPADSFNWIADIEKNGGHHVLPVGTFLIDRQYVLPSGTHLEGAGQGKTIIQAVYTGKDQQGDLSCGKYSVNRIGFILGENTYLGKFTYTGADWKRQGDNWELCGAAPIETPGCATTYCDPNEGPAPHGGPLTYNAGDGNGVSHAVAEDIEFTKDTVQSMAFMPQTEEGKRVSSDITFRNLNSEGTWADGLNIHGAHKNILVEGCSVANTGDDAFAAWDTSVEGQYLENITFSGNHARDPTTKGNPRDCFAQFGGRSVNYVRNTCANPAMAMIHFWTEFCGNSPAGGPGKSRCYPDDAVSYVDSNELTSSGKPAVSTSSSGVDSALPHVQSDSSRTWSAHKGYNCFLSSGTAEDPDNDDAFPNRSLEECQALCWANKNCQAITRDQSGNCWIRLAVRLDKCDQGSAWDTYTNERATSATAGLLSV